MRKTEETRSGRAIGRRAFFKAGAAGAPLIFVPHLAAAEAKAEPAGKPDKIMRFRPLGRTKLRASDVSMGTGGDPTPQIIRYAIAKGINYIDTAPDYGKAEEAIGEVLKEMKSKRDAVYIASKMCEHKPYPAHLYTGTKAEVHIEMVEASLKRLNTDYMDFLFVHAIGEKQGEDAIERLDDPELWKALDALKKAGKYRFLAVSSHSPGGFEGGGLKHAIDSKKFDLIMPSFSFLADPAAVEIVRHAHKAGVAVVAMKTAAGGKNIDLSKFKGEGVTESQAALKWALSFPEVSCAVRQMTTKGQVDEYVAASGQAFTALDARILEEYARQASALHCRPGCGACLASCPRKLPINDILRYQMYFEDYGEEKHAMAKYAALPPVSRASACAGCEAPCLGACPYGVAVAERMRLAHEQLSFA